MTKSQLISLIANRQTQLSARDVEMAVNLVLESISEVLEEGGRAEIRGFGSFSLHYRRARMGRNPKTGASVSLSGRYVPHFKPGKALRDRVNAGMTSKRGGKGRRGRRSGKGGGPARAYRPPRAEIMSGRL